MLVHEHGPQLGEASGGSSSAFRITVRSGIVSASSLHLVSEGALEPVSKLEVLISNYAQRPSCRWQTSLGYPQCPAAM